MSVTRKEVARHAGVSESTVSYVINNGPRPISEGTRRRVLAAIDELGYQPNAIAQSLRRQQTSVIGLVVPDTANPFYGEVARIIENVCDSYGYTVMVGNSGNSQRRVARYFEQLALNQVAGIVFMPTGDQGPTGEALALLCDRGMPAVVLDYPTELLPAIAVDQAEMGYLAVRHLLDLGHRRIGYVARDVHEPARPSRYTGYLRALDEAGVMPDPALVVAVGELPEDGVRAGQALLTRDDPPTAIFAHNDMNAIGVIHAARAGGRRVPGDLSVVGCDDIALAAFIDPPLTTVTFDHTALGTRAVERLIAQIEGNAPEQPPEMLPAHLVVRESSARVGAG
jgi:LacI family transcriptional regulator